MTPWWGGPLCAFALPASGVDGKADRIVAFGILINDGRGDFCHSVGRLVDPAEPGIAAAPVMRRERALPLIIATLANAVRSGTPLVAINASHMLSLLDHELHRAGLPALATCAGQTTRVIDPLVLDWVLGHPRRGRQCAMRLAARYGVAHQQGLLEYVSTTLRLVPALVEQYPLLAGMDLDELHEFQRCAQAGRITRLANFPRCSAASRRSRRVAADPSPDPGTIGDHPLRVLPSIEW